MRSNHLNKFIIFSVIQFLTIACALTTSTTRQLGSVYFTDEGGYEIQKVNDYTFKEFSGGFEMVRSDSKLAVGPGFLVYGGVIEKERTNEELWNLFTQEKYKSYQFEKPKNRTIDDIHGLIGGFQGQQGNVKVKGKIFVTMVDDNQQFILIGFAPEDEWSNFKSLFNKVLKTIKFYIPNRSFKFENKYKRDIKDNEIYKLSPTGVSTLVAP